MSSNLSTLADRLQAKLNGATQKDLVVADHELVELMDAHLDEVSGASIHGSAHGSGHASGHLSVGQSLDQAE